MDLDEQGTHAGWWNDRGQMEAPAFAAVSDYTQLAAAHAELVSAGYRWCVIDTPPRLATICEEAIRLADLVIIPCKHAVGDMRATMKTVELCESMGKKFMFLLNETNGKAVTEEARKILAGIGPVLPQDIPKNNRYWQALAKGKGITEATQTSPALAETKLVEFVIAKLTRKKEAAHV
jgi:chromosome partitioning protein